ncbi:hypothetical protein A6302_03735 [Methylobrevis pamukkalensis]|uniref:Uncharacterized protein n=1 Tax=Methylobrevis pamukkalensis TaxID=1439726 RepID=A0A1E3GY32_9HYPH|nr:hypothetical protein A6302_03735 [Methylobrevis pamukkalensis]
MDHGILDQVAHGLAQGAGVAGHGRALGLLLDIEADGVVAGKADRVVDGFGRQPVEPHGHAAADLQAVGNGGIGQKLGGDPRGGGGIAVDARHLVAQRVRILLGQRDLGHAAQAGERRAQLMGGLGDEFPVAVQRLAQAADEAVERLHQRRDLGRHGGRVERAEIGRIAALDHGLQRRERPEGEADREGDHHHAARHTASSGSSA